MSISKRAALAGLVAALASPAAAGAGSTTYSGGMDGGGKLGIDVKVNKKGKAKKITEIRGVEIPTVCDSSGPVPSHLSFPTKIKVDGNGKFKASFEQPDYGNVSTIKGRFKAKMVEGKISVDYHYPAEDGYPEEDCHTAKLNYQAIAGFPDPTQGG